MRFDECLAFVLRHEGGFVNDPDDAGGATNRGITQRTYNRYRSRRKLPQQSVALCTEQETRDIYRSEYWERFLCDVLPAPLDLAYFDTSVLFSKPVQILQALVGVAVDGIFGPVTLEAVKAFPAKDLARALVHARMGAHVYSVTTRPRNVRFLNGWLNRGRALLWDIG